MNKSLKPSQLLSQLNLPPQDLPRLLFCGSHKASAVKNWVNSLQATKVMQTSTALYKALPEIARLKTDYANRIEILELLRPSVQYSILGLQKSFLNQPLIMPEEAQKAVLVAQSLQKNMLNGYLAAIIQIAEKGKANKSTLELFRKAIHRAISGIGLLFFRNYQIYAQTPPNMWATLNILYQVAAYYELSEEQNIDPTFKHTRSSSITQAYTRIMMMDSAKTNQMSQADIDSAFSIFESWCQAVKIKEEISENPEHFLAVNLLSNQGPIYKSKIEDPSKGRYIELDFTQLLSQLSKQSVDSDDIVGGSKAVKVPKDFPESLLKHLLETWSNVAQRKFDRRVIETSAEVCVGLSDCHYFACNGQDFDYFMRSSGSAEPQKVSRFSQGLTPASHIDEYQNSFVAVHRVVIQNVSAGGYCLLWHEDISAKVSAGEVIGIKEVGKRTWGIGVIRWVRQLKNASQLGIQLLSNNSKPYGIAQTYEMGGYSEFMRALFLPPNKFGQSNPTLLTASAPFREFDKVKIIDGERETTAKLDRSVFSTKSCQQFRFRRLDGNNGSENSQTPPETNQTDDFDSSWE
ncbi:MAG: PilZ domain-containing protein [Agarilytica sp.]